MVILVRSAPKHDATVRHKTQSLTDKLARTVVLWAGAASKMVLASAIIDHDQGIHSLK